MEYLAAKGKQKLTNQRWDTSDIDTRSHCFDCVCVCGKLIQ